MDKLRRDEESVRVKEALDGWFKAVSEKNNDGILAPLSDGFVNHLPNSAPILGPEGLTSALELYKVVLGPVYHVESTITVSDSGDLAYEVGRHDHVMYGESGGSYMSPWNHIIVLKKIDGAWRIDGISETNIEPEK